MDWPTTDGPEVLEVVKVPGGVFGECPAGICRKAERNLKMIHWLAEMALCCPIKFSFVFGLTATAFAVLAMFLATRVEIFLNQ